jgi:tryptophan-rich sensory protein
MIRPTRRHVLLSALGFAVLFNLLGSASALMSGPMAAGPWYAQLVLPRLQPPGPVFGIAWTILYALQGVSFALLLAAQRDAARRRALALFIAQFAVNLAWSPLFFSAHQIFWAMLLIAVILALAIATTIAAARVSRLAAWLLTPYLVWLGFAFALNWRIWQLNGPVG